MTRIFIVDDHAIMRNALQSALEREPDLTVCGTATTAAEALQQAAGTGPDLVLIDVSLPDMSGIEVARRLRARYPGLPLAMLSGHGERGHVAGAFEAGVDGYILKGHSDELPAAIRQVMRGERYLSAALRPG